MTMPEIFSHDSGIVENDVRLERLLEYIHRIHDPDLLDFRFILETTHREHLAGHTLSFPRELIYRPPLFRIKENLQLPPSDTIRVRTTSDRKWSICEPIITRAGYHAIREPPEDDGHEYHDLIREWAPEHSEWYPAMVARMKQAFDPLKTPAVTFDTVTFHDGEPLEKPRDRKEAIDLISQTAGNEVTTVTAMDLGLQFQSGACAEILSVFQIHYRLRPLSRTVIADYVMTTSNVLNVPIGIDLSKPPARYTFIDATHPVIIKAPNYLGYTRSLTLHADYIISPLLDPLFAGVPIYALENLLPKLQHIFVDGDPFTSTGTNRGKYQS